MSRFVFMMLDGVGVGELPDAALYGDVGSDTLGNVSRLAELRLPNLGRLGLGNIAPLRNVPPVATPAALPGRLAPKSAGKDTTVGHWEHMGLVTSEPFPTYPNGFPPEILVPFAERIGHGVLGNKPASGTAIIDELGEQHIQTGDPIVYTSADSVFQIAAHVEVVPLEQLYEWCEVARSLLRGPHGVARVIARPFTGLPGNFTRTKDRRDFSLAPPAPLYLDLLQEHGVAVVALGKISEIFLGRGVTTKLKIGSNAENLDLLLDLLNGRSSRGEFSEGFLFTNLVDFDMAWGHRNDVDGFAAGLEAVDRAIPAILAALRPDDRLIISADHGVDPTTVSTDHSREYVPMLFYPRPEGVPDKVYEGDFSDTGATVFSVLTGQEAALAGRSLERLDPSRGWRGYTVCLDSTGDGSGEISVRLGPDEVAEAVHFLAASVGAAPEVAIVLGSGLADGVRTVAESAGGSLSRVSYDAIPHWPVGSVSGHPQVLEVVEWDGRRIALLEGRVHAYEGFDASELQFAVRAMAAWGVEKLILTCAAGAVAPDLGPGTVVLVTEVLDFQNPQADGEPRRLAATGEELICAATQAGMPSFLQVGVHAAVPGPQYETPAELSVLSALGASCVSMSLPAEIRAAHDEGLSVVGLSLVTNAGSTDHHEVLEAAKSYRDNVAKAIASLLAPWTST